MAASSYKFEVLLSWDMDAADPSSCTNVSGTGSEQQMSRDGVENTFVDSKAAVKQVEVSNGLMLHEVFHCTRAAFDVNADMCPLHVELGNAIGRTRVAGVLVHSAIVRSKLYLHCVK